MRFSRFLLYVLCSLLLNICLPAVNTLQAQSFWGYQTIGRHTVFFSLAWQGKPQLGFGYNYRDFGRSFTDWQAEVRFPVDGVYKFHNYQLITGFYKPVSVRRTFLGTGVHLRWQKSSGENLQQKQLSAALTFLPAYTYAASLNDGAYGTVGARITYAPVLYASLQHNQDEAKTQTLAAHRIEVGGHVDLHMERTLGLGLNVYSRRSFLPKNSILELDNSWEWMGDFYMGSTYRLGRN